MADQEDFSENTNIEKAQRIAWLIAGYLRQSLTPAEHDELDNWVAESDQHIRIFEELTDEKKLQEGLDWIEQVQTGKALAEVKNQLSFNRPKFKFQLAQYAAAAALLLVVGFSIFLFYQNNKSRTNHIAEIVDRNQDLTPGRNDKAVLTLNDGRIIDLANVQNGSLASQGNSDVIKKNGSLIYSSKIGNLSFSPMTNVMSTPRGSTYSLILSDGTKVWLNASSSLTYPVMFNGNRREVIVTGEAYFEVAKNKDMPFVVDIKDQSTSVEVLGTHFNINAYSDDQDLQATLLEGAVKISTGQSSYNKITAFLKPGQQAKIYNNTINIDPNADINTVMAWKNGIFRFNGTDLRTIMKQLSRWYDIDVIFETDKNPGFYSIFPKSWPASKVFEVLEESGEIHFKIEGKKVFVKPKAV